MNFNDAIVLTTDRVRLEPLSKEHLPDLVPITLAHPDLVQYSPSPWGSEEQLNLYIEQTHEARAKEERYAFAIIDLASGKAVGSTSYGSVRN